MRIDIASLKRDKKDQIDLNFTVNLDTIDYYGDQIEIPSPITVKGKLYVMEDRIYISCRIEAKLLMNCSRCLQPTEYLLKENVDAELVPEGYQEEDEDALEDLIFYQQGVVDLDEVVKESIFMNIPYQMLCSEDCKGLCAQCGQNLNLGQCHCSEEKTVEEEAAIDPRMAKLKELFKDN